MITRLRRRLSAYGDLANQRASDAEALDTAFDDPSPRRWAWAASGFALSLAFGLSYFLFQIPFQRSDNLYHLMLAESSSFGDFWRSETGGGSTYFRPGLWWSINAVYEAAHGHLFAAFKAVHALQIVAAFLLFVRIARVRSPIDVAAVSLGLVALIGMHTFVDNVVEAYPINTYLTIIVASLISINLVYGRHALWRDASLVLLFAYSIFTVESGVLVLVIAAAGYLVGFRGVSVRALGASTAVLGLFVTLKFAVFQNVVPALDERSSGFWFRGYDQAELLAKFGDDRYFFYTYNVVSSFLSVFFAEPRAGIWRLTRSLVEGPAPTRGLLIAVLTSTASTIAIGFYSWSRRRSWRRLELGHYDRLVVIAIFVALANAVMSFPYTKDVILGPAGVFYALAFTAALRALLLRLSAVPPRRALHAAALSAIALISLGWTIRALSVPYEMARYAHQNKQDWADIEGWLREQKIVPDTRQVVLIEKLRKQVLASEVPAKPQTGVGWDRYVDRR